MLSEKLSIHPKAISDQELTSAITNDSHIDGNTRHRDLWRVFMPPRKPR